METFRTTVKFTGSPEKTGYDTPMLMLGSCFAENVGNRLLQLKFDITLNPFGIVYHPAVVARNLQRIITGEPYIAADLQLNRELWYSFDHHGRFSHTDAGACLNRINSELARAHERLAHTGWLFVTFGTAWAYRLKSSGRIVANCHKLPASGFERMRSDAGEIYELWKDTVARLQQVNRSIRVVFTVSPIRHLRDGAHENQLSKAILLLAVDQLNREVANTGYFPAYEIMLDDLRDYRFYGEDMTHPDTVAVNYIWQHFCESYMSGEARQTMTEVEDVVKASAHMPIHRTAACRAFAAGYIGKAAKLQQRLPQSDFSEEIRRFEKMLE